VAIKNETFINKYSLSPQYIIYHIKVKKRSMKMLVSNCCNAKIIEETEHSDLNGELHYSKCSKCKCQLEEKDILEIENTYVIIYKATHKQGVYEEDPDSEYGNEIHYLKGKTLVEIKEVGGLEAMQKECEGIGEANADNPPYDEYEVILVYEKMSKEVVPEQYWYPRKEGSGDEQ
jgi:hypothetical protein